jgi:hypothetical protein
MEGPSLPSTGVVVRKSLMRPAERIDLVGMAQGMKTGPVAVSATTYATLTWD